VLLLGTIGTAMTYVGISPFWAKAIQGLIILAALVADAALARFDRHGSLFGRRAVAAR
jgi:rhamnose transport system permease protein